MTPNSRQLRVIAELYDAAIDAGSWSQVLDRLAVEVGAKSAVLLILETIRDYKYSISKCSSHINADPDHASIYEQHYSHFEAEHFKRVAQLPAGNIINEAEKYSDPAEFRSRPDVAFLEQHFGIYERFAVRLNPEKAWFDCITFQYDRRRGNITDSEAAVLHNFIPHIAKVTSLSRTFTELEHRYRAVLGVLDRLLVGVFLVFGSGDVLLRNRTADNIIMQKDGFFVSNNNRLMATDQAANAKLLSAIESACCTAIGENCRTSSKIKIPRQSGTDSYLVDVFPIRDTLEEIDPQYKGALVMVLDYKQRPPVNIDGLKMLYELTDAEASVAYHLIDGRRNKEIAEIRGTKPESVKSLLKSLFAKTESGSRTELLSRLLSISPPIE